MKGSMTGQGAWKSIFGIELYKLDFMFKRLLYKTLGLTLPKLKDQRDYWTRRGQAYMHDVLANGVLDREAFFQDMLIAELEKLNFSSSFEAGCGFGWNIRRIKEHFPHVMSGGLDFSPGQLANVANYAPDMDLPVACGDNCRMPFKDKSFDVGFSVGVFMNINADKIGAAVDEMIRVCRKYAIHLEYDENQTTQELKDIRAFKTNIISHDFKRLYEERGKKVIRYLTYKDFGDSFNKFEQELRTRVDRWEGGFEGPGKYVLVVVEM